MRVITFILTISLSLADSKEDEKLQIGILRKGSNCNIKSKKGDTVYMSVKVLNKLINF
jgi:hypothetical protein